MAGLATSGETTVVSALTGVLVSATGSFVGLHSGDPGTTTITGEISGNAYARQSVTWSQLSGPNPTVQQNSAIITFPTATPSGWGSVGGFSINTASSAGTFYGGGLLTTTKTVNAGDTARFAIGALTITVN